MKIKFLITFLFLLGLNYQVLAESDDHHEHDEVHEHESEHEEDHGDEHGDEHEHESKVSDKKAIMEVNHDGGIKLSKEATSLLEIETIKARNGKVILPHDAIVFIQKTKGFYLKRDEFYYFIEVESVSKFKNQISFNYSSFKSKDEIVISGVELLRVSDVFSKDESEYGHGH